MDKVAVTHLEMEKNNAVTGEKIFIKVYAYSITEEPVAYRLPFVLGNDKLKV